LTTDHSRWSSGILRPSRGRSVGEGLPVTDIVATHDAKPDQAIGKPSDRGRDIGRLRLLRLIIGCHGAIGRASLADLISVAGQAAVIEHVDRQGRAVLPPGLLTTDHSRRGRGILRPRYGCSVG